MISQDAAIRVLARAAASGRRDIVLDAGSDDVGVLRVGTVQIAVSSDYTNFQPIGAELGVSSLRDRGYLLIIHNVSDLLGSGAKPLAAVVALGLPDSYGRRELLELGSGIREAADHCGVAVIGGDTKAAPMLSLCATVFGSVGSGRVWRRDAAKAGDTVFLSGAIGGVSAALIAKGLKLTPRTQRLGWQALSRPKPPIALASRLRRLKTRIAAIDISDGLGKDLHTLLDASGMGVQIDSREIPVPPLVRAVSRATGLDPLRFIFGLGGDAQFVFTAPANAVRHIVKAGGVAIGTVSKAPRRILLTNKGSVALPSFGHLDFTGETAVQRFRRVSGEAFPS